MIIMDKNENDINDEETIDSVENYDTKENEIIEISNESNDPIYDTKENSIEEKRKKINISKKIVIILLILITIIIIILLIVLLVKKGGNHKLNSQEPTIIIEKDNYIYEDGTLIFKDKNNNEIGKYKCNYDDEKLCFLAKFSNEDDFDVDKFVFQNEAKVSFPTKIIDNRYVFIYDNAGKENGLISLYDLKNN